MKKRYIITIAVLVIIGGLLLFRGPAPLESSGPVLPEVGLKVLESGLNKEETVIWRHLDEGSGFFPLSFFRSLEDVHTGRPFIEVFPKFGFIPDPANKLGLPVGLSAGRLKEAPTKSLLVGVSCSACHTGQYNYKGAGLLIDGAPNMLRFRALLDDMNASVAATLESPKKLLRLTYNIAKWEHDFEKEGELMEMDPDTLAFFETLTKSGKDADSDEVAGHLEAAMHAGYHSNKTDELIKYAETFSRSLSKVGDKKGVEYAHSILQAFHSDLDFIQRRFKRLKILNKAFSNATVSGPGRSDSFDAIWDLLVSPDNISSLDAPVSIPHLFDYATYHWGHWDGNSSTVLERDFAQAIALGADLNPETGVCSVIPENVIALETVARSFQSPSWPEDVLGKIDQDKAKAGEPLYQQHCAPCHSSENVVPLEEIGTDPTREQNFANLKKGGKGYWEILQAVGSKIVAVSMKQHQIPHEDVVRIERDKNPSWKITGGYHTRTLNGIWASAPYLHNGSVPTIWDLLQPVEKRPADFLVGRELDPKKLGIDANNQPSDGNWRFDVTERGNGNQGHEHGTALSDDQKWSLVEYLKTL